LTAINLTLFYVVNIRYSGGTEGLVAIAMLLVAITTVLVAVVMFFLALVVLFLAIAPAKVQFESHCVNTKEKFCDTVKKRTDVSTKNNKPIDIEGR